MCHEWGNAKIQKPIWERQTNYHIWGMCTTHYDGYDDMKLYNTQANQIIGTKYRQLNHRNNMAHRYYNSIAFNLNHLRVGSSLNSWKLFCEILLNINNYYLNIIVYILAKKEKREKKPNLFPLSNQFCVFGFFLLKY